MDRRRLETAHFRYAILVVTKWYPSAIDPGVRFYPEINDTLLEFTPMYHLAYHQKYSGQCSYNSMLDGDYKTADISAHRCEKMGCGSVLVLDGNMKNRRDVCAADHAGFVEYAGLPGKVKTGCMNTPEQRSKFCSKHKPRQVCSPLITNQGEIVEEILRKKTTRTNVFYEVMQLDLRTYLLFQSLL